MKNEMSSKATKSQSTRPLDIQLWKAEFWASEISVWAKYRINSLSLKPNLKLVRSNIHSITFTMKFPALLSLPKSIRIIMPIF